ncbi:0996ff9d-aff8-4224-acaa-8812ba701ec8 [Thermothielavioides terrestris]|uniref:0996ff9d-aff8-4224-acaa-8812ba701ec8 n=1 Tax=Thermothielavioides terrestris TaxID=2587410 RepID=A0A446BLK6_9PEZI|nr:0996ff9d-aff8-4224-acaa-8812ba701ec8 [Thermothielavioides terrestris]
MASSSFELLNSDAQQLVDTLWPPSITTPRELFNGDQRSQLNHDAYWDYYQRQWHIFGLHADKQHAAVWSPAAVAQLARDIQAGKTWEELMAGFQGTNAAKDASERSLNLAARLLAMVKVGVGNRQFPSRKCLRWEKGSLRDFVHDLFREPPRLSCEKVRLPRSFDAWAITNVAGIEIAFTDNLADHLLLTEDDSKLHVFHHAFFLECHRGQNSIFPDGLVEETLRTQALLFPQSRFSNQSRGNRMKRKWMQNMRAKYQAKQIVIDARLGKCGTPQQEDRQIEHFHFWRDRLVILKQAYDDSTPKTLGQWWRDRRNGVQWYTFWVAILVLITTTFFSIVQVVEGALQVYKAYVPSD